MQVRVYRNSIKNCWYIQTKENGKWKLHSYRESVSIKNAKFNDNMIYGELTDNFYMCSKQIKGDNNQSTKYVDLYFDGTIWV